MWRESAIALNRMSGGSVWRESTIALIERLSLLRLLLVDPYRKRFHHLQKSRRAERASIYRGLGAVNQLLLHIGLNASR